MLAAEKVLRGVFFARGGEGNVDFGLTFPEGVQDAVLVEKEHGSADAEKMEVCAFMQRIGTRIRTLSGSVVVASGGRPSTGSGLRKFWLVLGGEFGVWPSGSDQALPPIKVKRVGEFFGEIVAFCGATKRTATVKLSTDCRWGLLLEMRADVVLGLVQAGNASAVQLVASLLCAECKRVEQMDGIVRGLEAEISRLKATISGQSITIASQAGKISAQSTTIAGQAGKIDAARKALH